MIMTLASLILVPTASAQSAEPGTGTSDRQSGIRTPSMPGVVRNVVSGTTGKSCASRGSRKYCVGLIPGPGATARSAVVADGAYGSDDCTYLSQSGSTAAVQEYSSDRFESCHLEHRRFEVLEDEVVVGWMNFDVFWSQLMGTSTSTWATQLTLHRVANSSSLPSITAGNLQYDNGLGCEENEASSSGILTITSSDVDDSQLWAPGCDVWEGDVGWINTPDVSFDVYPTGEINLVDTMDIAMTDAQAVRCDWYRGNIGPGCVIFNTTPILQMSTSNPDYGIAAANYAVSQDVLQGNPGRHGRGKPDGNLLVYTSDEDLANENRRNKCRGFVPANAGDQCDEYPPASTTREDDYDALGNWQGVDGVTYDTWSVSASQNSKAGSALQVFYQRNRVMDGDLFYIEITS